VPHKPLYDITKFTALDYPDHLAAIFWFAGCNMRCPYCYNKDIVFGKGKITEDEALEFLKSRRGLLEGVVLSGGECTMYKRLEGFCRSIKELGFKIKLDTNGIEYETIKRVVEASLIDYIALDYKAPAYKFLEIAKSDRFEDFSKTLEYLIKNNIHFEARTTIHSSLLDENDINVIIEDLKNRGYERAYYLQRFVYSENSIGKIAPEQKRIDENLLSKSLKVVFR